VNSLGVIDLLQIAASGLQPGVVYQLWLVDSPTSPSANHTALARFTANASGAASAQAIGPLRTVAAPAGATGLAAERRYLIVTAAGSDQPVLRQQAPP
jgi:hypothetical protein